MMTDVNAQSGTDRVAEVAAKMPDIEIFVNVQGDEPEIEGKAIDQVIQLLQDNPKPRWQLLRLRFAPYRIWKIHPASRL